MFKRLVDADPALVGGLCFLAIVLEVLVMLVALMLFSR